MSIYNFNLKKLMVIFVAIGFFGFSKAQISELPNGVEGIWETAVEAKTKKYTWDSQWIWLPESIISDVMLTRRSFELETIPDKAVIRITASSKYELYINEVYVCQGPARSAPHHQSFDILDIQPLLKVGKNNISVRVHHQKEKISYHLIGRAGLLVQLDFNEGAECIITNNEWKVSKDPSWDNDAPAINRFQKLVNDRVDLRKQLKGWNQINYNDSNWENALPLLRNSGWPAPKMNEKATALTTPWTSLIPRDIPYLRETYIKATHLIEARSIQSKAELNSVNLTSEIESVISKQLKGYLKKDKPIEIPPLQNDDATWFLLFDFGKVISGMPKLVIEGKENTEVKILSAPFVIDNRFTHKIVDSNFEDQLILSGKKDTWQAMYFKPTRYMALAIKGNKDPVKIHSVGIHQLEYPFELKGTISVPEAPWIEDLWSASAKTIDVCTTDAYTDNYRERRQYAQTGYYAALGNYYTYGDTALQRRYLLQVAQEQEANGMMPAYAPLASNDYMVILDSNCLWIRSLYNYYRYTGDDKTVKELVPAAKKLMTLLHSYTNDLGLLNNPPYAYWLDHTLNDRRGANTTLNGHYLGALKDFSQLLSWLEDEESSEYVARAEILTTSLRTHLWDEEKQLFADALIDGKRSSQFSEHANAMILAEEVATVEQAEKVIHQLLKEDKHNFIIRENGMTMVSPAMSYYLHKGISNYGHASASLNMLNNRFAHMLKSNTNGTLWEEWWRNGTGRTGRFQERTRSDAQTESVFAPSLFAEYVFGLKVTKPGMKELTVAKPETDLSTIETSIPTPQGVAKIGWEFGESNMLKLFIPENMQVKLDLESLTESQNKISINGKTVTIESNNSKYYMLNSGLFKISF